VTAPALSVLLPYRNAAATLPECLDSVLAQTWPDFELLCIDDGSDDAGPALVAALARADPRVRRLRTPCPGLVAALNLGLRETRAPLVARMDADDVMHPRRLELQHAVLTADPTLTVLGSRVQAFSADGLTDGFRAYVDWQNACLEETAIAADIYLESPLAHPSVMFRTEHIRAAGDYRDGPFPEDYELWLRLHRLGLRMGKLPQALLQWRDHPGRLSRVDPRCDREAFDALRAVYLAADPRLRAARERLVIWGAGRRTRRRAAHLLARGCRPVAWIDIDPRKVGNRIAGVPVVPPDWLCGRRPRPFVLCYVATHGARPRVEADLARLGYRKGVDYLHVG
jgi:hypothetical protein